MTRVATWSKLKAWAMNVAKRRGAKRAKVALARKLGVVLHRMWVDETEFRFGTQPRPNPFPLISGGPRRGAWAGTMVRGKPLDALALRRRFRDRLPCTSSDRIM